MSSNDDNARTISVKESPLITKSKLISNHNLGKKTKSTNTLNNSSSCNVVTAIDYYIDKKINNNIKIKVKDAKAIKTTFEQFVENRKRYDKQEDKTIDELLNSLLFMINIIITQVIIKSLFILKIITTMIDLSYIMITKQR